MKNVRVDNKVKLVGKKNFAGEDKLIDYYIQLDNKERIYKCRLRRRKDE